jgi:hypothetical protein
MVAATTLETLGCCADFSGWQAVERNRALRRRLDVICEANPIAGMM